MKIHGDTGTRLYAIWKSMKRRCAISRDTSFANYGARGIKVCTEWIDNYPAFRDWALANGYRDDLTIDRKDVNGDYCPENCRWATKAVQANNTRANHILTYNGETHTVAEWAGILGINQHTLLYRIRRGWTVERALHEVVTHSTEAAHAAKSKPVKCIETGIIYPSASKAAASLGLGRSAVSSCVNGHKKTAGGFHWEHFVEV